MKKIIYIFLYYIILFINSNLLSDEKNNILKVGLLAPLSGEYKELGNSLVYSLQLALDEINDDKIFIIPRDSGLNNKEMLNNAIKDIRSQGANIVIGPLSNDEFEEVKKYNDMTFISPSNILPEFSDNIISIGISLESQLLAINNFLKKQKKNKTVIMFPNNQFTNLIEKKIKKLNLNNFRIFKYNPDPQVLTGEIEILTNYSQRKKNLELRKRFLRTRKTNSLLKNWRN